MENGEHAGNNIWLNILIVLQDNRIIHVDIYNYFGCNLYILETGRYAPKILAVKSMQGLAFLDLQ